MDEAKTIPSLTLKGLAVFAVLFGAVTLISGNRVLFGDEAVRIAAGDYVPFVLWFNFLAGFAYVAAGAGLFRAQEWARVLAFAIAGLTLAVFAAFGIHALGGGNFEMRTVGAMALRSLVWIGIAWAATVALRNRRSPV